LSIKIPSKFPLRVLPTSASNKISPPVAVILAFKSIEPPYTLTGPLISIAEPTVTFEVFVDFPMVRPVKPDE
jgi:hypothetical protein